jgi:hypothetical protein
MGLLECRSRVALSGLVGFVLLAGGACKHESPSGAGTKAAASASTSPVTEAPPPSSATSTAAASASAEPFVHYSGDLLFQGKCPNYVRGARTQIVDTKDGIRVTITVADEAKVAEIRSRSRYLAEGKSQGGDGTGHCPVPRDAKIGVVEIEHGVELNVLPPPSMNLKDLRKRARQRAANIPAG